MTLLTTSGIWVSWHTGPVPDKPVASSRSPLRCFLHPPSRDWRVWAMSTVFMPLALYRLAMVLVTDVDLGGPKTVVLWAAWGLM